MERSPVRPGGCQRGPKGLVTGAGVKGPGWQRGPRPRGRWGRSPWPGWHVHGMWHVAPHTPPETLSRVGVSNLEVPRELVEAADVPEDHVPVAAEVEGQQVIVAEPDEELPSELGHGLGHGGQAAPQYSVQVLIGVILCVQERVCRAVLPGQGGERVLVAGTVRAGPGATALGQGPKSHLQEGELNGRNPRKGREGIGATVHGQRPDPGEGREGQEGACDFRVAHVFPPPSPTHTALFPARPHLHLGFPAVVGDHHLLVEGLPTAVGRVHLGVGLGGGGGGTGQALAASSFPSSPAPGRALACFRMFSMRPMRRGLVLA